jgi:hypothetical protein
MIELLEVAEFADGSAIVLRDLGAGVEPFATHYRSIDGSDYYWGHYFRTEQEGREDFEDRVAKNRARIKQKGEL